MHAFEGRGAMTLPFVQKYPATVAEQPMSELFAECRRMAVRSSVFDWKAARPWGRWVQRLALRTDERIRNTYFPSHDNPKLYLGCGKHRLPGWLNTDYYPRVPAAKDVLHLDASRRFPFDDGVFSHVYSEHMIEHLVLEHGIIMLMESFRVLRSGGRLRIGTPSFEFLVRLYETSSEDLHKRYIDYETGNSDQPPEFSRLIVVNKFVRAWGHLFIYDEELLATLMTQVGFADIRLCQINESDDPVMRNLANVGRLPAGLLQLATFTLEGRKP
jgi:predicted SAM-dependent methyltransferase